MLTVSTEAAPGHGTDSQSGSSSHSGVSATTWRAEPSGAIVWRLQLKTPSTICVWTNRIRVPSGAHTGSVEK